MALSRKVVSDEDVQKVYAIYIRVSTDKQALEGDSLEMQENLGRKIIEDDDGILYKIYVEPAVSASKTSLKNRYVLQECLADARNGLFNTLIVYRRDRLARKTEDSLAIRSILEDAKCELLFSASGEMQMVLNDPYGKLMENIRSSLDEIESAQISIRVSDVMIDKAKRGEDHGGNLPFGYIRQDGKIIQVEDEIKIIEEIEDLYLAGYGIYSIAKWLNGEKIKNLGVRQSGRVYKRKQHARSSEYWTKDVINTILFNPYYTGIMEYSPDGQKKSNKNKETIIRAKSSVHEGCRTEEKHNRILRFRELKQSQQLAPRRYSTPFLLTGLLYCGECGEKYISRSVTKSNGNQYHYYTCNSGSSHIGKAKCNNRNYKKDIIEDYIIQKIKNKLDSVNISSIKEEIYQQLESGTDNLGESLSRIEKNIQRYTKDYASIRRLLLDLDPDDMNYQLLKESYQEDQAELLRKLNENKNEKARLGNEVSQYSHIQESQLAAVDKMISFKEVLLQSEFHNQKLLLDEIVEKIVIYKDGKVEAEFYIPLIDTVDDLKDDENINVSVITLGGVGDTTTNKNITVHLPLTSKLEDNMFTWMDNIYTVTKENLMEWLVANSNVENPFQLHTKTGINYHSCRSFFNKSAIPSRHNWSKIESCFNLEIDKFVEDMQLDVSPSVLYSVIESVNNR